MRATLKTALILGAALVSLAPVARAEDDIVLPKQRWVGEQQGVEEPGLPRTFCPPLISADSPVGQIPCSAGADSATIL